MPTPYSESQIWESEETKSKLRASKEWEPGPPATLTATLPPGWTRPRTRRHGLWADQVSCQPYPPPHSLPPLLGALEQCAHCRTARHSPGRDLVHLVNPWVLCAWYMQHPALAGTQHIPVLWWTTVRSEEWQRHRWGFEMVALVWRPFKMIETIMTCSPELLLQAGVTLTCLGPCQPWSPTEV